MAFTRIIVCRLPDPTVTSDYDIAGTGAEEDGIYVPPYSGAWPEGFGLVLASRAYEGVGQQIAAGAFVPDVDTVIAVHCDTRSHRVTVVWGAEGVATGVYEGDEDADDSQGALRVGLGALDTLLPAGTRVYADVIIAGTEPLESELRSVLTTPPWEVWHPSRMRRLHNFSMASQVGPDVVIPDVAAMVGGPLVARDAVVRDGDLSNIYPPPPWPTMALALNGSRWGWGEWADAVEQADGVTLVCESSDATTTALVLMRLDAPTGDTSLVRLQSTSTQSRLDTVIQTSGPTANTADTVSDVDSAGYFLRAAIHVQVNATQDAPRRVRVAPSGTASASNSPGTRTVRSTKRRLIIGANTTAGVSPFVGNIARWAVWSGVLTDEQVETLYADVDWSTVLEGLPPLGYWLPEDGVDDGTTLVVPPRYAGADGLAPSITFVATQRSDLTADIPTREAP